METLVPMVYRHVLGLCIKENSAFRASLEGQRAEKYFPRVAWNLNH